LTRGFQWALIWVRRTAGLLRLCTSLTCLRLTMAAVALVREVLVLALALALALAVAGRAL
jgi:hypothetical protein